MKNHPDKNRDNPNYNGGNFKLINEAYSILSDYHSRKKYDQYYDYYNNLNNN